MTWNYERVSETAEGEVTRPIAFAHRGARLEEPENTIAAFRWALEAGVTGLETDVWRSADGEPTSPTVL